MIKKYKKRPVEIEAIQLTESNIVEAFQFVFGEYKDMEGTEYASIEAIVIGNNGFGIPTLEGTMKASIGDYIIKGVKGEFYPCKESIFLQTYESVND